MAGCWADNFGWYTRSQLLRVYSSIVEDGAILIGPYGRGSGPGLRFSGDDSDRLLLTLPTAPADASVRFQFDVRISAAPSVLNLMGGVLDGGTFQLTWSMNTDRTIRVYRGENPPGSGTLLDTSSYVVPLDEYVHFGVEATIGNSGSFRLLVWEDGDSAATVICEGSSVDTQQTAAAQWTGFALCAVSAGETDYANLVAMDGSGGVNNALLGPADVSTCYPTEDAQIGGTGSPNTGGSTPSTGSSRAACVDDSSADDDVTTVNFTTVSARDTYEFQDAPYADRLIAFSVLAHVSRKTGAASLAAVASQEGVETVGGTSVLADDYTAYTEVYDTAPDASVWGLPGDRWNAMTWGADRVA